MGIRKLYMFLLAIPLFATGQVGIGTSAPVQGSVLDVVSNSKGVLIPRLQLTGINDIVTVPVTSEDIGMMVYNLEDSGVSPLNVLKDTYYLWTGSQWEDISTLDYAREVVREHNVSTSLFIGRPANAVTANASASYTVWTNIDFADETLDSENIHNAGTFTIAETALYAFAGGISLARSNNSGASKSYQGRVMVNGVEVASSMFGTSNGGSGGFIPLYWNGFLNAGDTVQIQYRMRDSQPAGTFTLNVQTNMSIIKNSN